LHACALCAAPPRAPAVSAGAARAAGMCEAAASEAAGLRGDLAEAFWGEQPAAARPASGAGAGGLVYIPPTKSSAEMGGVGGGDGLGGLWGSGGGLWGEASLWDAPGDAGRARARDARGKGARGPGAAGDGAAGGGAAAADEGGVWGGVLRAARDMFH
jgi:hypothetical protein